MKSVVSEHEMKSVVSEHDVQKGKWKWHEKLVSEHDLKSESKREHGVKSERDKSFTRCYANREAKV